MSKNNLLWRGWISLLKSLTLLHLWSQCLSMVTPHSVCPRLFEHIEVEVEHSGSNKMQWKMMIMYIFLSVKALHDENNAEVLDFVRKESCLVPTAKWLCPISAEGYLFHWTLHLGFCRSDHSGSLGSSVTATTEGRVNLGYSTEGSTGERVRCSSPR